MNLRLIGFGLVGILFISNIFFMRAFLNANSKLKIANQELIAKDELIKKKNQAASELRAEESKINARQSQAAQERDRLSNENKDINDILNSKYPDGLRSPARTIE